MAKGVGTFQPKTRRRRLRVHGFLNRKRVNAPSLARRRAKGRRRLA